VLVALLVCLIPTTIGGLLSAIGVAGMSRMMQANVIATSGRAVEGPATWTCCCWTRPAPSPWATARPRLLPAPGVASSSWPTRRSWPRWPTKRRKAQHRGAGQAAVRRASARCAALHAPFVPFTAQTRMSGVDLGTRRSARARPTPCAAVERAGRSRSGVRPWTTSRARQHAAGGGRSEGQGCVLGVIELKDIVKGGIRERFAELRRMGIRP
jgi:K+-transporting ATPase ATPase B chain